MKPSRRLPTGCQGRRRHLAISIAGAAALALVACGEPRTADSCKPSHAALIPAYLPPAELAELVRHPDPTRIVVVNPDNGPGSKANPAYADAIAQLKFAGTRVLGYVSTGFASRDPTLVRTEIARYASWYNTSDIFVDQVAAGEESLPYYAALSAALRAGTNRLVVFNPGRVPAHGYFGLADIVVTFEGTFADYRTWMDAVPSQVQELSTTRTAHLIFGASEEEALEAVDAGRADYVYANSGTLPNPWRTLPSSLTAQQAGLARC